jgi:O-antigen ligase
MTAQKMSTAENGPPASVHIARILFYGTFGLLMFGPLAFGAVEAWSIFLLEAVTAILVLLWLAKQWSDGEINLLWNPLYLPMGAFAVLLVAQLVFGISAYRHDTVAGAMLYCAYGMLCFLATQTLTRSSQARKLAVILSGYGAAVAVFALLQGVAPNGKIYWMRQPRLGGWIYGPYVNHNHYAGLMELLIPVPLVISVSRLVPERTRIAAGVAAAIMAGTVFLSGSRGGMIAVFAEVMVLAVLSFRKNRSMRIAVGAAAFVVVLVSLLSWLGGKELTTRVSSISTETRSEISGGTRLAISRDALRMFGHRPVLGWGLGSFPIVYPKFRSFYTNFFVNEAHNDYAQLLVETGVLGFGLMIWFFVIVYRRARAKIGNWMSSVSGATTLACSLGVIGIAIHSLFDFNLQIPANAALFYVFCSTVAAPPLLQRSRKHRPIAPEAEEFLPASEVV